MIDIETVILVTLCLVILLLLNIINKKTREGFQITNDVPQEDRIETLKRLKSHLESIDPNSEYVSWFEDKVKKQEDVIKKHLRDYNLSLLLNGKDSL
jgi:hypothetical protein